MHLFKQLEKTAHQYPDNIALVDIHGVLTYSQLVFCVNEKAAHLKSIMENLNVESKPLVAIMLEKSNDYIVSELACNKLDIAFLPLVKNQKERNENIITLARPALLLTSEEYVEAEKLGYQLLAIQSKNTHIYASSHIKAYPEKCRYVIFTSGTTGTPKGIMLEDKAVVDVVITQAPIFEINEKSRFAWLLSSGFDASLSDIYATLFSGAALYIPDFSMDKIKLMGAYFKKHSITHSDISPSVLPLIKNRFNHFESLKAIIFGGEVGNIEVIRELSHKVKMINAYGPTETTICSSVSVVDNTWTPDNIGQPLPGVEYHVSLDGELLIGGSHVALGYMNNIQSHKFFTEDNKSWYHTGDLVEYKNNSYYFKGRIDRQFKYHGQLICPEEIESAANLSASSSACYFDGQKIHLFYTGVLDETQLMKGLTSYMKPHFMHQVETLPLNSNGKIDPKQLSHWK